jgi:hypothetical protein
MNDMRKDSPFGSAVASELVGNNDPGLASRTAKKFPKEPLGGEPVAFWLNEDVDHGSVLIDCTPKIMPYALDLQEHLIQMPLRS